MPGTTTQTPKHPVRVAMLAAISLGLVGHAMTFNFINDDAFISFRYADNLVRHGELVFNLGERVEGYTNFLWTIMMAGVIKLDLDPVSWSKWLGIALGVGTLWIVARFTARYFAGGASLWDALAPALLAGAPAYACWCTGGLETQLFTFFATLGWTEYLIERERGARWPRSGLFFALSAMSRPEGMLLFGLTGLHRLVELWVVDRRALPTRQDWVWGLGFLLPFVPYYAWRWTYYGYPFPNTYYVKTGAETFWRPGLRYFGNWVLDHHIWAVALLAGARRTMPTGREGRLLSLVGLYTVVMSLHVIRVGGDFMALYRFFVPIMPALAVVAVIGLRFWVEELVRLGHKPRRLVIGGAAIGVLLIANAVAIDARALEIESRDGVDSIGWLNQFVDQCTAIGKHLVTIAPEGASLATTAAGAIPYYSRLRTLDILGINDEWIAHNVPARGNRPGHTKTAPLDYILEREIDYLIYQPDVAERPQQKSFDSKASAYRRGYLWETMRVPGLNPPYWGVWVRIRQSDTPR